MGQLAQTLGLTFNMVAIDTTTQSQMPPEAWAALTLLWIVSSIAFRLYFKKPIFAVALPNSVFSENWVSTRMGTGIIARLGVARNCTRVQVTTNNFQINPHFPFTIGFMPEIYDLDYTVPLSRIRSATILSDGRSKAVEIKYFKDDGSEGSAQLLLRNAENFVQAVLAYRRDA